MQPMPAHRPGRLSPRPGFTLIELLVVVIMIALLVGIVMAVGVRVTSSSKERLTEGAIQALETALVQFEMSEGSNRVPAVVEFRDPQNLSERIYHPVADALGARSGDSELLDSVGLFIKQLDNRSPDARSIISGMNSKLVKLRSVHDSTTTVKWDEPHQSLVTVLDAWGNPVRYVHPAFDGEIFGGNSYPSGGSRDEPVQLEVTNKNPFGLPTRFTYGTDEIRRVNRAGSGGPETPDADGGICPNNKPYFYSAGPDGLVGFGPDGEDYNADNVYIVQPRFPENQ
ncbi:MAG: type II secretion system protein [Planctomycetes bacterium]|nr:type II secretion system protein [Planctomycetota bacterium]